MSKNLVTLWDAYRYEPVLDGYERVRTIAEERTDDTPLPVRIALWYEDETESSFYIFDAQAERDAAIALGVHGLIECKQQSQRGYERNENVVLVRDYWTKQPLGKLVCTQDEIDRDLGLEESEA